MYTTRTGAAAVIAFVAASAISVTTFAQGRNCPDAVDQVVTVSPGQPAQFRLNVVNAENAQITIFQFPLGGVLQQNGSSSLDFVFTPQFGFNGSTDFTYRVIPPYDCPRSVQLGRVTLVGGYADSTAPGLVPTLPHTLCGIGSFAPLMACAAALFSAVAFRRHSKTS